MAPFEMPIRDGGDILVVWMVIRGVVAEWEGSRSEEVRDAALVDSAGVAILGPK
jgi:hypothetical protein